MSERINVVGNLAKDVIDGKNYFGGSAANIAIGVRKLGLDVGIISVLGRDKFSSSYRDCLLHLGIDISQVPDTLSILPVCEVFSKNNTNMDRRWKDNGCKNAMEDLSIKRRILDGSLIHIVSCPFKLTEKFLEVNAKISYEPGPMLVYSDEYFNQDLASKSSLIFLNEEEYKLLLKRGIDFTDTGNYPHLEAVVLTLGGNGSILLVPKFKRLISEDIPPIQVPADQIVDFTGAGDNYKAGFLAAYTTGKSLIDCAIIASEMGAMSIKNRGGVLPDSEIPKIRFKFFK